MGLMTAGGLSPSSRRRMLLPPEGALFIRRRIEEVIGLALIIGSAMLLLAWLSYAPTDPSPLRAAPGPVKNLFGAPGAAATDVGVQAFGLGYLLFIAVLSIWGWRLFAHRGLNRLAMRVTSVAVAVLSGSVAFGALPIATGVDLPTGPGGAIGQLFLGRVLALGPWIGGLGGGTIGIAAGVVAALATIGAVGFGADSWRQNLKALTRQSDPEPAQIGWGGAAERRSVERPVERALERPAGAPAERPLAERSPVERAEPSLLATAPAPRAAVEPSLLGASVDSPARDGRRDPILTPPPAAAPRKSGLVGLLRKAAPEPAAQRQLSLPLGVSPGAADSPLDLLPGESSHLPPVTLLAMGDAVPSASVAPSEQTLAQGRLLIAALADFGVAAMIAAVRPGPLTTSFELEPAPGVKTARVVGLADDIAATLGVPCIRIAGMLATARPMIVVELPNADRATLTLRPLLSDAGFERTAARLTRALGRD
ncbi:MAG: DNA translocase FtsK 4TM domain-containing protein, partial [Elsteraceae bacterium]